MRPHGWTRDGARLGRRRPTGRPAGPARTRSGPGRSSPSGSSAPRPSGGRWATASRTPRPSPRACARRSSSSPTPRTSPDSSSSPPGSGPRTASGPRSSERSGEASAPPRAAIPRRSACSWRTGCCASPSSRRAGSPSGSSNGRCPASPSGRGSSSGVRAARRRTGSPSTPSPIRWARASSPSRTAGRSSSSSSTRRRAGSAASSARRSPPCRSRTGPPAATRSVARRGLELLGMLIGDAEPDVQKALAWAYRSHGAGGPAGDDRRARESRPSGRLARPTAIGPGSSAMPSRSSPPPMRPVSVPASTASAAVPAPLRPPPRPGRPPASPTSRGACPCRNRR